jgi:hypothetical protein
MSEEKQREFTRLVGKSYQQQQSRLALAEPSFRYDGFISRATLFGSGGTVEIACGPPEYHTDIFVASDSKRWSLADLIVIDSVRDWMLRNRANIDDRALLEVEIDHAFRLLVEGLKNLDDFKWLYRSSPCATS